MAQGVISRLTYERLGILLTDAPAYKESGSTYGDLIRVQSLDYGFEQQSVDIKAVGSDKLVTRNGQSPVVREPNVNCNINYLFSEGQNEIQAGLHVGKDASILSNFLGNSSTDDVNVIVVASNENQHKDLNFLSSESDFQNYNVIGIGNAFLTNYEYNASVGEIPTSSLSYSGSNMKLDFYDSNNKPTLPAIKLGLDNIESSEALSLDGNLFDEEFDPEISVIKPGEINVTITKKSGDQFGAPVDHVEAAIQAITISVPLTRQDIYGFGSNHVFNRKLKLPIIGAISMDLIVRGFDEGSTQSFFDQSAVYDMIIDHPISERLIGVAREHFVDENYYYIAIDQDDWRRTAFQRITRAVSGIQGDRELSTDENYYHVCVAGNSWGSIPLTNSSKATIGNESVGDTEEDSNYGYVFTSSGWKHFAVTTVNFDLIDLDLSYRLASKLTFDIRGAQLKAQSYQQTLGDNMSVNTSFIFAISKFDGMQLYFS